MKLNEEEEEEETILVKIPARAESDYVRKMMFCWLKCCFNDEKSINTALHIFGLCRCRIHIARIFYSDLYVYIFRGVSSPTKGVGLPSNVFIFACMLDFYT